MNPALAEVREDLLALPDDAAHALDPEPGQAPGAGVPPGVPPPPPFVLPEHLAGKPDAALRQAQDAALAAGLTPEQANAAGRAAAEYVLAHGTSPETVHKRELLRGTEGGLPPDEVVRLAREAGDRAAAAREAARTQSPPAGESPRTPYLDPAPSTTPAGPPAAALSPRELKDLEKLAGGTAAGGALLKLLQEQGAVAGPGVSPFATPLPEVPVTAPGPGEGAGVAPVPAPGPAPGFPEPPETQESPGPGGVPWETLAGLAREAPEGPSRQAPWDVVAGLGEAEPEPYEDLSGLGGLPRGEKVSTRDSPFGGDPFSYAGRVLGRGLDELLGPGGDYGPQGGGETADGGGMMEVLVRIAEGVQRLVDLAEQQQEAGGASGGWGPARAGGFAGAEGVGEDYTAASPSIDTFNLSRPGQELDAAGRPLPERPKRQRQRPEHPED
jgi:hypothetical protein